MAYISNVFRVPFKHFQCNGGGLLEKLYINEKSQIAKSNFLYQLRSMCSYVRNVYKPQKNESYFAPRYNNKNKEFQKKYTPSKFSKINLKMIVQNSDNLRDGAVLSLFHKILSIYYASRNNKNFNRDLKLFSMSYEFNQFCKILNAHLRTLSPNVLIHFLHLEHFNVHVQNPVMQRILFLIYDNMNCYSLSEILEIYVTLKRPYFQKSEICEKILQACEEYFKESFEDELNHSQDPYELVYYLHECDLPLSVRKFIAEKYFDYMEKKCFRTPLYITLFSALFQEPLISLYKPQILEHLKNTIGVLGTGVTVRGLTNIYQQAVYKNESIYSEEVCNIIAKKTSKSKISLFTALGVIQNLCFMGYLNYDLMNYVANNFSNELKHPVSALNIASIFARSSFHEKNHSEWNKIKNEFQKLNALEMFPEMCNLIKWCEYLTYLGCDTTYLLSHIFKTVNSHENDLLTDVEDNAIYRQILRLHHFARSHVSESYEGLLKRTVNNCIEKAKFTPKFLHSFYLNEVLGSEDFILENCTTSSQNLLPAVIILGPDNKPINLSSYQIQNKNYLRTTNSFRKFQININIDNIKKPPGSKMIVFDCFMDRQPFEFCNAPVKSGVYQIFLKSIKDVHSNIIVLHSKFFDKTPEEKLKFLKSKIHTIIKSREALANNQIIL